MYTFMARVFHSHWFRTFMGIALLAVLVWFFGPLLGLGQLHPLETTIARWITIGVLFFLWLVINLLEDLRAYRKDKELASGIAAPSPDASATASATLSRRSLRSTIKGAPQLEICCKRQQIITSPRIVQQKKTNI